jgi:hypothetical protein
MPLLTLLLWFGPSKANAASITTSENILQSAQYEVVGLSGVAYGIVHCANLTHKIPVNIIVFYA